MGRRTISSDDQCRIAIALVLALILGMDVHWKKRGRGRYNNSHLFFGGIGLVVWRSSEELRLTLLCYRLGADAGRCYAERFESQAGLRRARPW